MTETQTQMGAGRGGNNIVTTGTPDGWNDDVVKIGDAFANLTLAQAAELREYLEEKRKGKS